MKRHLLHLSVSLSVIWLHDAVRQRNACGNWTLFTRDALQRSTDCAVRASHFIVASEYSYTEYFLFDLPLDNDRITTDWCWGVRRSRNVASCFELEIAGISSKEEWQLVVAHFPRVPRRTDTLFCTIVMYTSKHRELEPRSLVGPRHWYKVYCTRTMVQYTPFHSKSVHSFHSKS